MGGSLEIFILAYKFRREAGGSVAEIKVSTQELGHSASRNVLKARGLTECLLREEVP